MRIIWLIIPLLIISVLGISEAFAEDCETGHTLIFKILNKNPACVSPSTAEILVERGWGMMPTKPNTNTNACQTEPDTGLCKAAFEKYYFDPDTSSCESFIWGGCGGSVPFDSLSDCQIQCEVTTKPIVVYVNNATGIIDANNQFALKFYSKITKSYDQKNVFYSPWSIMTAFAIAHEGAGEDTSEQMQNVFGFSSNKTQGQNEFKYTNDDLNQQNSDYKLQVANGLWLADFFEPNVEYVNIAKTYYDSEVKNVDFIGDHGVNIINQWVSNKTNDKIKNILAPDSTNELTRLVITNAIYFKGTWVTQFDEQATKNQNFTVNSDVVIKTPMMNIYQSRQLYGETENTKILQLPYKGDKLSMLILLPKEIGGIDNLEDALTIENLKHWKDSITERNVKLVSIPKFELKTEYNLIPLLYEMGITDAFGNAADFSGITEIEQLFINSAIHKAYVDVNEEGTEAAAVTAIGIVATSENSNPRPVYTFVADHPFIFAIQDNDTGQILFIGKLTNPTK